MSKSHPSGINPSKKAKRVLETNASFCFGKVKLTEDENGLFK